MSAEGRLVGEVEEVVEPAAAEEADLERRFGGLRRLYGDAGYRKLRSLTVAVVGVGGVGSWAVEALARCGVAGLVLIDFDQIAESNINRQVHALGSTVGMAKVMALEARVADIHPNCRVLSVEEFATPENWPALLPTPVDVLIDACDQVRTKVALAAWALQSGTALVCCGAAGGKQEPTRLEVADMAAASHDPLLASVRNRLRREHGAARSGAMGVRCVFSREETKRPDEECALEGGLNCHGYGSSVMLTASMGFAASAEAIASCLAKTMS
jgi:tRNA A37 threonylcarbamoyladenosine dehydratase